MAATADSIVTLLRLRERCIRRQVSTRRDRIRHHRHALMTTVPARLQLRFERIQDEAAEIRDHVLLGFCAATPDLGRQHAISLIDGTTISRVICTISVLCPRQR